MYIKTNGQLIRQAPSYPPQKSARVKKRPRNNFSTICKQLLFGTIILYLLYTFTCGKCKDVLKLLRL